MAPYKNKKAPMFKKDKSSITDSLSPRNNKLLFMDQPSFLGNDFINGSSLKNSHKKIKTDETESSAFSMYSSSDNLTHKKNKKQKNRVKKNGDKVNLKKKSDNQNVIMKKTNDQIDSPLENIENASSSKTKVDSEKIAHKGSLEQGINMLNWIMNPYSVNDFFKNDWEKKPLYIERKDENFYKSIISGSVIDNILRNQNVMYSINLDITTYEDGKRLTHNPVGRALPHAVWDFYANGCSVRLLNPQTFIPKVHLLNATLQDYFNCFVGANVYLTPPNSQGFAPHYDDIEAMILQIEGKKKWRIYNPLSPNEELPRFSSRDFSQEEIGNPIMEITLKAGDFLYFPRGFIHQAVTVDGEHSLHVTLSMCQKHSWGDLFQKILPQALESAMQNDKEFRKSLPLDLYANNGFAHSETTSKRRDEFMSHVGFLFDKLSKHISIDKSADELSKEFLHSALPPVISEHEKNLTVFGDSDVFNANGDIKNRVELELTTEIRLLRANIIRMIPEEGTTRLYHIIENSKVYHENDIQYLEIDDSMITVVKKLILSYPKYVCVNDLEADNDDDKIRIVSDLWERGLLMTKKPLTFIN